MACGDIIYRSTLPHNDGLTITAPGVAHALAATSYLWATPGVAPGFFDMFVLAFAERLFRPTFRKDDFMLGKKLCEGAFGVVYKASLADPKAAEKRRKWSNRVNRSVGGQIEVAHEESENVFQGDVVVKKGTEYGAVEIWMNEHVRRAWASSCADFVYGFRESKAKGKGADEYWLVWHYEGEDTLCDLMQSKSSLTMLRQRFLEMFKICQRE